MLKFRKGIITLSCNKGVAVADANEQVKKPTSSKELAISKLVEDVGIGDKVLEIYGPTQVADSLVWEVWVKDRYKELATRFVEELPDDDTKVYDTFQQIAVRLNIRYQQTLSRAGQAEWERQKELIEIQAKHSLQSSDIIARRTDQVGRLSLTGFGFVASILISSYVIYIQSPYASWAAAYVFISFVANAGRFMLGGKFEGFKIPKPWHTGA